MLIVVVIVVAVNVTYISGHGSALSADRVKGKQSVQAGDLEMPTMDAPSGWVVATDGNGTLRLAPPVIDTRGIGSVVQNAVPVLNIVGRDKDVEVVLNASVMTIDSDGNVMTKPDGMFNNYVPVRGPSLGGAVPGGLPVFEDYTGNSLIASELVVDEIGGLTGLSSINGEIWSVTNLGADGDVYVSASVGSDENIRTRASAGSASDPVLSVVGAIEVLNSRRWSGNVTIHLSSGNVAWTSAKTVNVDPIVLLPPGGLSVTITSGAASSVIQLNNRTDIASGREMELTLNPPPTSAVDYTNKALLFDGFVTPTRIIRQDAGIPTTITVSANYGSTFPAAGAITLQATVLEQSSTITGFTSIKGTGGVDIIFENVVIDIDTDNFTQVFGTISDDSADRLSFRGINWRASASSPLAPSFSGNGSLVFLAVFMEQSVPDIIIQDKGRMDVVNCILQSSLDLNDIDRLYIDGLTTHDTAIVSMLACTHTSVKFCNLPSSSNPYAMTVEAGNLLMTDTLIGDKLKLSDVSSAVLQRTQHEDTIEVGHMTRLDLSIVSQLPAATTVLVELEATAMVLTKNVPAPGGTAWQYTIPDGASTVTGNIDSGTTKIAPSATNSCVTLIALA